jgi:hypothetical protein
VILTHHTTHVAAYQSPVDRYYDRIKSKYPDLPLEKSEIDTPPDLTPLLIIAPRSLAAVTIEYDPLGKLPLTKYTGIISIRTAVGGGINYLDPREPHCDNVVDKFAEKANHYLTLQDHVSRYDSRLQLYPTYFTDNYHVEWKAPGDPTHDPKVGHLPWGQSFDNTWIFTASKNPRSADYIGRLLK